MFQLNEIINLGSYCRCTCACKDAATAETVRSSFIGPVRQISMFADLYREGSSLILEAPDHDTVRKLADILNHSAEEYLTD